MPKEDGIVQRHAQLQHSGHRLGDIADLPQEEVAAHVPQDGHADAAQKDQRQQEAVHGDHQHDRAKRHRNAHINRFLILDQLPGVRNHGAQAGHEALFPGRLPHFADGFHGFLGGGAFIEEHGRQHAVAPLEHLADMLRDDFRRKQTLRDRGIADHAVHMGDFLQRVLHVGLLPEAHPLRHQQGKRPLAEILKQDLLPLHRFQILGQVIQKIVFGLGGRHAKNRRHHQHHTQDDDRDSVPDHPFGESFHAYCLPTFMMLLNIMLTLSTMWIIITPVIDFNNQLHRQSFVNKHPGPVGMLIRQKSGNC